MLESVLINYKQVEDERLRGRCPHGWILISESCYILEMENSVSHKVWHCHLIIMNDQKSSWYPMYVLPNLTSISCHLNYFVFLYFKMLKEYLMPFTLLLHTQRKTNMCISNRALNPFIPK